MRLLLLEDDANTAAYVSKGLEEEGHTVDHLSDGRDAVAKAGGTVPDLAGPIIPWIVGSPDAAVRASLALRERGLLVQPIRPL